MSDRSTFLRNKGDSYSNKNPIKNRNADEKRKSLQTEFHLKRGYVQVYFGNGKGKTTAALGLAVRAAGCGLKVYIAQFIKGLVYSELKCLEKLKDSITVKQFGRGCFIKKTPTEEDIEAAKKGMSEVREVIASGRYDVVILDEITVAEYFGLVSVDEILGFIDIKPENVELVLTGRKAAPRIIDAADLVTEMVEVKHYYNEGIQARRGIEK
ncbi:MAG: cob(I)yrinic acid a,c-diamide adenosyltransferase [Actinobacteria bacterium]|nr:cob(I)yrinic acid a,c-diamide adenosyltransferase [Actinomycetota bacterium]